MECWIVQRYEIVKIGAYLAEHQAPILLFRNPTRSDAHCGRRQVSSPLSSAGFLHISAKLPLLDQSRMELEAVNIRVDPYNNY